MKKRAIQGLWAMGLMLLVGCGGVQDQTTANERLVPVPVQDGDPANGAVFATDVSFWETPLSQAEMDCFWDSGVRHVIVGTQEEAITREQLAMAVSRGMTVDAYVYLYWDTDMTAQVKRAFSRVSGFPIGRMWLDIEQDPGSLGAAAVVSDIQQAVTACQAQGGVECGIYTGKGFWQTYAGDTQAFSDVPLWWAHYDGKTLLSTWADDAFGGWTIRSPSSGRRSRCAASAAPTGTRCRSARRRRSSSIAARRPTPARCRRLRRVSGRRTARS